MFPCQAAKPRQSCKLPALQKSKYRSTVHALNQQSAHCGPGCWSYYANSTHSVHLSVCSEILGQKHRALTF